MKAGSDDVEGKGYLSLNLSDQAGEGKPWESLMPADGDNAEKNYFTFWEFSSNKFIDQTCTAKRKIGKNDIGKIKIEPNVDYNVYLGAKIYVSKGT